MKAEQIRDRKADVAQGYNSQDGVLKVTNIRRYIHWVTKEEDPLVCIADALTYELKRFFSRLDFGDQFHDAIIGKKSKGLDLEDFSISHFAGYHLWSVDDP